MIILGEGNINLLLCADLSTDKLVFKSGDKLAGSDGKCIILALSAVKSFSVYKTFKIKLYPVAILNRALNLLISCILVKL